MHHGGPGDGFDTGSITSTTLTGESIAILYEGGSGDGSTVRIKQATSLTGQTFSILYEGGSGDGSTVELKPATSLTGQTFSALYEGGSGDGFTALTKQSTSLTGQTFATLYSGGAGDGFASTLLTASSLEGQSFAVLFQGGLGDGSDVRLLPSTSLTGQQLSVLFVGGAGDGHSKHQEADLFGDYFADSDSDGMPDGWENTHGLNPFDPSDAALDSDDDNISNLDEYLADTDPTDPHSYFWVHARLDAFGNPEVYYPTSANRYYLLETSPDLEDWTEQGVFTQGTGGEVSQSLPNAGTKHFGRIIVREDAP